MKNRAFLTFFSIFLTLYGLINYYIFIRGYNALEAIATIRPFYTAIFIVVAISYIVAKFVERKQISIFTDVLSWVGSFWFAFILYYFIAIVSLDILRLLNLIFHIVAFTPTQYTSLKLWIFIAVNILIVALIIYGYWNAKQIKIKTLNIVIDKPNPITKELTIVMASDIHLGTIIGRKPAKKIVDAINALHPDIILLPGDILDSEVEPVVKRDIGAVLLKLNAKYGIYGVTGNHEYIGGVEPAVKYIREHGIDVLRDETREIAGLTVIGREDRSAGKDRKALSEIMLGVDRTKPVIMMDHQPAKLSEAVSEGVDVQVSGHTHRGQLFPLNFITKKVYELDWGYLMKGKTHFYVSCGVGTWGPPVKIGNDAEIIKIRVKFA